MIRQNKWRAKNLAAGLCRTCGKRPRLRYLTHNDQEKLSSRCELCLKRDREQQHRRRGWTDYYGLKLTL